MTDIDPRLFREALGLYPTGVTVVTTLDSRGQPVGMTVNSFTSLSLDPPLILWNPGRDSFSFPVFEKADHFAVHVLHAGQQELSNRFALRSTDKFDDIAWNSGLLGSPILPDYAVCLQCRTFQTFPGGDHMIVVGQVLELDNRGNADPLVFHAGRYGALAR